MATPFQSRGFLPFENPVSQWVEPRRNALMGLSAGFLSGDPSRAMTGAMQGAQLDQQYAQDQAALQEEQQSKNATVEYLRSKGYNDLLAGVEGGGLDIGTAWAEALKRGQPQDPGANLMSVGGSLYDPASGQWISPPADANGSPRVSLSGQWGFDENTQQPVYLQPSETGAFVQAQPPAGVRLMGPYDLNAERAAGSVFGKGTGSAQFDLPAAQLTTQQTLQAIENVKNNTAGMEEQFGTIAGVIPQQMTPAWPGSPKANFQVDTNRLINRTFLEAREVLRGGGQITDFESRKAEGAISSLEEAMQKGDKALFQRSLDELEQAVRDGYAKLQAQAGTMGGYGNAPRPQQNGGTTSSGVPWSISGQ